MGRFPTTLLSCIAFALTAGLAHAATDPVRTAIHTLSPAGTIDSLTSGPMPGMVTAIVDGAPLYVSADGRFVMQGHLYDLKRGVDLAERQTAAKRAVALAKLQPADLIVMKPTHPKYRVIAFVDTDCGYCQLLVSNAKVYLDQGIEIDFASWPREGADPANPTFRQAETIWCSRDRLKALQETFAANPPAALSCANPVASQAAIADSLQLPGTPAILTPDGAYLGGLVGPAELAAKLVALPRSARR